ncbi:MAG: NAD(P)/FAD-dependent oxidoreductase [Planctomycetes bacterium]|nr:NAD(P)/FAD-dependent oxidoreductase [Planctomycetota bacterium]
MAIEDTQWDVAIVGGGAAGLATAIFAARAAPRLRVVILDGATKLGAKILVSGGGRCNVTNVRVTPADYWGGSRNIIKKILAALSVEDTIAFFRELNVPLHEEPTGKLFPDSNSARTVLDALLREATSRNVRIITDHRVTTIHALNGPRFGFEVVTAAETISAGCVVLATGGLSFPKTGSDGGGYELARQLGHTLCSTTPGLDPLLLDGNFHTALSGLTQEVELTIRVDGESPQHLRGSLLWTHFGVSGPAAMNTSRVWNRARLDKRPVIVTANLFPDDDFATLEKRLLDLGAEHPKSQVATVLAMLLPARQADAVLAALSLRPTTQMSQFPRDDRRRLINALLAWPMPIRGTRGYAYAEVTAGGVPLTEINPATMESRVCPGLYLVGEILDVDGRIGGFNFQWAWSGGYVAGKALAARHAQRGI